MALKTGHRSITALLTCLVILVLVNLSIADKQRLLSEGQVVYLELAPIDPRSLMQGDYMALNYRLAEQLRDSMPRQDVPQPGLPELAPGEGRIVARLDERSVASLARLQSEQQPLAENEVLLRYRVRHGQLKFASNAFFFQEGTAAQYESAHYGGFRVAGSGDMLLTSLHDEELRKLGE